MRDLSAKAELWFDRDSAFDLHAILDSYDCACLSAMNPHFDDALPCQKEIWIYSYMYIRRDDKCGSYPYVYRINSFEETNEMIWPEGYFDASAIKSNKLFE